MELLSLLRCPTCRGALAAEGDGLRCAMCDRDFEVIHGIPDLRPDLPAEDRHGEFCREIIRRWPNASYRELWGLYHKGGEDALRRLWTDHQEHAPERGERRWATIARYADAFGQTLRTEGLALDIGCGMGSALFALARRAALAVGLDILLTDLLLAKKRFAEAGLANVALVCGSATGLPLTDEAFDVVNATDVIEHVGEQARLVAEARRVMRGGGVLFLNSPNRFSLLTPEPHVKLWWMGWLPRRWMEPYVRWRLGKPYRSKRLLSSRELRRTVRAAFGRDCAVRAFLPRGRLARGLLRPAEALARPVLPQHNVLAWKAVPGTNSGEEK